MSEYGSPISEVLGDGFRTVRLPAGWTALEGIVLVKCLDEDGNSTWAFRETAGINEEEIIGALTVQLDLIRRRAFDSYLPREGDSD